MITPETGSMRGPQVAMVAGEASGDLLAGLLLGGMQARWPRMHSAGIGGQAMQAKGFSAWWPYDRLAVHGFTDALKRVPELLNLRRHLVRRIVDTRPDVFIGVDAPDFNLGVERRVRAAGIRTVHFVSPSIWAWRGWRLNGIGRSADLVLCLFPFEPAIYERAGIEARYVGHPLADVIELEPDRNAARQKLGLGLQPDALVALLPGSRHSEASRLGPLFLAAARELVHVRPQLHFALPVAPGLMPVLAPMLEAAGLGGRVSLVDGQAGDVLAACDVAIIASGTATLEAALYKRPMTIAYQVDWFTASLMRHMGYLPWVGLPNILCNETVVPERLQEQATPERLAQDTLAWLDAPERVTALEARFTELHHLLRRNTAQVATDAIAEIINCH